MSHPPQQLPALVLLGDTMLMQRQPQLAPDELSGPEFEQQLRVLVECMHHYGGIGIAAPQIGWAARVFCLGIDNDSLRYPGAEPIPFGYWINPEIVAASPARNWAWEGCLSVPGMRGWVQRPATVQVRGLDEQGREREQTLDGFAARVFQHEYDHLDGVLYPQRISHPRYLLPDAVMADQPHWANDWPSPGARRTAAGELSEQE